MIKNHWQTFTLMLIACILFAASAWVHGYGTGLKVAVKQASIEISRLSQLNQMLLSTNRPPTVSTNE